MLSSLARAGLLAAMSSAPLASTQCDAAALVGAGTQPGEELGAALALDLDLAAVGAPAADAGVALGAGAVYVFRWGAGGWSEVVRLTASDAAGAGAGIFALGERFGQALAVDGVDVVVGAPYMDDGGVDVGAAYAFREEAGGWSEQRLIPAELLGAISTEEERLGSAVAIDGDTLLVGAPGDDGAGLDTGAVFVFRRSAGVWTEEAVLTASDAQPSSGGTFVIGDGFGGAVAVEGDRAVVGAPFSDALHTDAGRVYVFERAGSAWTEVAALAPPDWLLGDHFGAAVALRGDRLIAGSPLHDHAASNSGAAYLFRDTGSGWGFERELLSPLPAPEDYAGSAVALHGGRAMVGARAADNPGLGENSGAAFVFVDGVTGWRLESALTSPAALPGEYFGSAVALSPIHTLVGAPFCCPVGSGTLGGAHAQLVYQPSCSAGLWGDVASVSVSAGGVQALLLSAGDQAAAGFHLLLGSLSGSEPPLAVDGLLLPLVVDAYFMHTLQNPNAPPLVNSFAALHPTGFAQAAFELAPLSPPGFVGVTVTHAFAEIAFSGLAPAVVYASGAVDVLFAP